MNDYIKRFQEISMADVASVGGKNASLGEMIGNLGKLGIRVPGGFATTTHAFHTFVGSSGLDALIAETLEGLDVENVGQLTEAGRTLRAAVQAAELPRAIVEAITELASGTRKNLAG